MGLKFP